MTNVIQEETEPEIDLEQSGTTNDIFEQVPLLNQQSLNRREAEKKKQEEIQRVIENWKK